MQPRYYQQDAHDAAFDFIRAHPGENSITVLPTGAGKSLLAAMLCKTTVSNWGRRAMILQHRKELVTQNADKLEIIAPEISLGYYSAGLNKKVTDTQVVSAGIQSCYDKAHLFGDISLVIVDEAHMINPKEGTMYARFLGELAKYCPQMRYHGLTATPFRTGSGSICGPDKLFREISYEADVSRLIGEGFLCPIVNNIDCTEVDMSNVGIRGGEFVEKQMQAAFGDDEKVAQVCSEIVQGTVNRNCVLVFASGVDHAEKLKQGLEDMTNLEAPIVIGDTPSKMRDQILKDFKDGHFKFLINVGVLTTGFDAPNIDAIAVVRSTMSPGLFAQIVGRGLRLHPSKINCLLLDFGGNIRRHGPIDADDYGRFGRKREGISKKEQNALDKNGRGKPCPSCNLELSPNCKKCPGCGHAFPANHDETADYDSNILGGHQPKDYDVKNWRVFKNTNKKKNTTTLRVEYICQEVGSTGNMASRNVQKEWVCLQHDYGTLPRRKADQWWKQHCDVDNPGDVDVAIRYFHAGALRMPDQISMMKVNGFDTVINRSFSSDVPDMLNVDLANGLQESDFEEISLDDLFRQ